MSSKIKAGHNYIKNDNCSFINTAGIILTFLNAIIFTQCNNLSSNQTIVSPIVMTCGSGQAGLPSKAAFQKTIDGKQTDLYVLRNKKSMQVAITNYGGRIVSLIVPDKDGHLTDVVVGFDSLQGYKDATEPYYGATIGRFANRIAKGKFVLDNHEYILATNQGDNHLHGGKKGFQYAVWDAKQTGNSLELEYLSKDMEEGYPGNLKVKVTFTITDDNELKIDYEATTDKKTVINLTNHSFFNLNGQGCGTINDHLLMIHGDNYTPIDSTFIPTGKIERVAKTPFDFRMTAIIGSRLNPVDSQLKNGKGYDHNFVLNDVIAGTPAATVTSTRTGISMDVFTGEPGIQFYGGNFMQGINKIKEGKTDDYRTAFCLEPQHFPDSPNKQGFPSTVLNPGKIYKSTSVYRFSIKKS